MLQMFLGWEGVGFASYILISFWYEKESANAAGLQAFIVNRISDFAFLIGIFACFALFNSLDFNNIFSNISKYSEVYWNVLGISVHAISLICFLFFIGAMGKSAQIGFHTWLPDAMEGPTPVSALIHSATMVSAGVFMVVRLSPMFEAAPMILSFITVIGVLTCLMGGLITLTQFDIKRVIAYSTISQLGFMFFAIGLSLYSAAMFHLIVHAFFKALLFLTAGSVIHALNGEQDMRKMGGLKSSMPYTYYFTWIGAFALMGLGIIGFGGLSGFYSKELILESAIAKGTGLGAFVYYAGALSAFITALYVSRMVFMAFFGHRDEKVHESPMVMILAMAPLAFLSVFLGSFIFNWFSGSGAADFWNKAIVVLSDTETHVSILYKILPITLVSSGFAIAFISYDIFKNIPLKIAYKLGFFYRVIYEKFYFDEFYNKVLVKPYNKASSFLWNKIDEGFIDKKCVDGISKSSAVFAKRIVSIQTGYIYHYAFAFVVGLVLIISWFIWRL